MRIFKFHIYALLLAAFVTSGCSKDDSISVVPESNDLSAAKLKVIYASAYTVRDSVQIKLNDVRVSNTFMGNSTTNLPTPFPGGGLNTGGDSRPFYLSVAPGQTKIFISVPKKNTSVDSIIRFSGEANLLSGRYYSAYLTDTLPTSKLVLTEDNLSPVDTGVSRFKFVNLIPNVPAVDLYFGTILIAANVAYGTVSPEFTLPRLLGSNFRIRVAGASPTAAHIAIYPAVGTLFVIPNQRVMTIFAKGYNAGTVARVPVISLLYNR